MGDSIRPVEIICYKRGEIIFREGEPGECMYYVQSGSVGVYADYGTEKQKLLTTLSAGSFFGEMGMVRGFPRSATAVSEERDTGVSVVGWDTLAHYFQAAPSKIVVIMQQMAKRIGELSDDSVESCAVINRLLDQRERLIRENQRLEANIVALKRELPPSSRAVKEPTDVPLWQKLENGESEEQKKSYARYREEYRSQKNRMLFRHTDR